jgi:hypothetical protein
MERKSFELYVQTAAWTGGIAAAATGGVLLVLLNPDVPRGLVVWLRWIGISLLVAIGAAAYVQFHAIAVLNALERDEDEDAQRKGRYLATSQLIMFWALGGAAICLAIGLLKFEQERKPDAAWTVAGVSTTSAESFIIMTRADSAAVKILTRNGGEQKWTANDVVLAPVAELPRVNEAAPSEDSKKLR